MENNNAGTPEITTAEYTQSNKLPIIGFLLMLAGPSILFIARVLTELFGYIPEVAANIICWMAIILTGSGGVISFILLRHLWKLKKLGDALVIITAIMCNPLFFFIYFIICGTTSKTLAGLSWM